MKRKITITTAEFLENASWLLKQLLQGHFTSFIVHVLPMSKLPEWIKARWEWVVIRETNDPPDEFYLPWRDYWRGRKQSGKAFGWLPQEEEVSE